MEANMRRVGGLYFLVMLWFWVPAVGLLSPKGVNFEVEAFMRIKGCLEDPRSVLGNWDRDSVDPCSWTMVTCSPESFVVAMGTPSQNLSSTLSASIGNLTNLQIVLLLNNNISGPIPPEIGKLSNLRTLDLSNNLFTGEIPTSEPLEKSPIPVSVRTILDISKEDKCVASDAVDLSMFAFVGYIGAGH